MKMREKLELLQRKRAESEQGGGADRIATQHEQGQADRPRTARRAARSGLVRGARSIRHASRDRLRPCRPAGAGRRRRNRVRPDRRPAGLRLLAGLHRVRRLAVRNVRREDLQGDGPRRSQRRAHHRPERFGRRAHSGGCGRRSAATPRSFCATRWRRASCRRSAPSSVRVPVGRSTARRSPTSSSWCAGSPTCSSPGRTS